MLANDHCFTLQVERVLKPGGIVGLVSLNISPSCVDSATMMQASKALERRLFSQFGYPEKIQLLEDNYKSLVVPYPTRRDFLVDMRTSWTLKDYLNMCMTFSQVNSLIKSLGLSTEEGHEHVIQLLKEEGMTEEDMKSVYTWSQPSTLVAASKP